MDNVTWSYFVAFADKGPTTGILLGSFEAVMKELGELELDKDPPQCVVIWSTSKPTIPIFR